MLPHLQNIATWARGSLDFWQRAEVYPTIHPSGEFWWLERPDLHTLWQSEPSAFPKFVQESEAAMKYLDLLGPLDWTNFPERPTDRAWPGLEPAPRAPFVASFLIRLDKGFKSMPKLVDYLIENPALIWLLGFPLKASDDYSWGFDVWESLCTVKHFSRILRELNNDHLSFLLHGTVHLLQGELVGVELADGQVLTDACFGNEISLDTKHIIAWVVENNPNEYIANRYDKQNQPKGDPDCKLGCKERKNQKSEKKTHDGSDETPTQEGMAGSHLRAGQFYWGYGSGVVATKIDGWAEIVLAEMTQTFDQSDVSYFKPLMARTEAALGKTPQMGALDAAFDAFYVYEYFHLAGGMAAVPLRKVHNRHNFSPEGAPICQADIPFELHRTYNKQSGTLYPHQRERYRCPLIFPEQSADACPINHKLWPKGGCNAEVPASIGARIATEIDREGEEYKRLYKQRTATERINSLALDLGIERPKLRNKCSITNQNTLIYILINMRALKRIQARKQQQLE